MFSDFDSYFYENGRALRNKLDIHSVMDLEAAVSDYAALGMDMLLDEPVPAKFDAAYLRHVHKVLFGDVYEWAGDYRACRMSRNQEYCDPGLIRSSVDQFCVDFNESFISCKFSSEDDMAQALSHSWAVLNKIHPFRDGNGRSQYVFFDMACRAKGYGLAASKQDLKILRDARDAASMGNDFLLCSLLRRSLVAQADVCQDVHVLSQERPSLDIRSEAALKPSAAFMPDLDVSEFKDPRAVETFRRFAHLLVQDAEFSGDKEACI